jgi:hypothetical protein
VIEYMVELVWEETSSAYHSDKKSNAELELDTMWYLFEKLLFLLAAELVGLVGYQVRAVL